MEMIACKDIKEEYETADAEIGGKHQHISAPICKPHSIRRPIQHFIEANANI